MSTLDSWEIIFKTAVDQSFNAVLITNANFTQGGPHIIYANSAFCRMTHYSEAELLGCSPRMFQGEFTDPSVIAELRHCLKHNLYFHGSTVNYRKDGVPYYVEWNISPIRNQDQQVTHYVSVQQNISDYIRAEHEHMLLLKALNSAADPILIADNTGHIVFANTAFEQITGYEKQQVIGKTANHLLSVELDEIVCKQITDAIEQGTPFCSVFSNRHKNDNLFFAKPSDTNTDCNTEEYTPRISVGRDITDLLQREILLHEIARLDKTANTSAPLHTGKSKAR